MSGGVVAPAAASVAAATAGQQTRVGSRRATGGRGVSPLLYACQQGDVERVKRILASQPTAYLQKDRSGKTALHYCTTSDNISAAQAADILVMAAPDLVETRDEDGFTPLHLAVIAGNIPLVTFLLANKADVNAVDSEKHTVVHWATVCGETVALRAVIAAGAPVSTPDVHGGFPLHYAAQMCGGEKDSALGLQVLHTLLSHSDIIISVEDGDGRQPLLWAASAGSAKAVLALVRAGAAVEAPDKDGLTALHCAASRGHTDCIDTLLTLCGASPDVIDSNGCTALHYAVTLGHADATALLLAHGADPNRQDRKGRSPAHCGCAKGQFETVKMIGAHGANLWLRNARGDLPLHEAAASGRRDLVKWLLEARPSQVNARNNDGRCPLHLAALNDNADMCKILLDAGAQVNPVLRTSKNAFMTPLDCALQRGFRSTAKYLQCHGGVPSSRLGSLRPAQVPAINSAFSLQIRDDVTFWGETTSDSEREAAEKEGKQKKKAYKRKHGYRQDKKRDLHTETEFESGILSTAKLDSGRYTKRKSGGKREPAKSDKQASGINIDPVQCGDNKSGQEKLLNYTSEIKVTDRGDTLNIQHIQNGEIVFSKSSDLRKQQGESGRESETAKVKVTEERDISGKRPRSTRLTKVSEISSSTEKPIETVKQKFKADTPDPRRKDLLDDSNNNRQLLIELKKELITQESKATQYSVQGEEMEPTAELIEKKVKSVMLKSQDTASHADQQSFTSYEDGDEQKNFLVEASIHPPPKEIVREEQNISEKAPSAESPSKEAKDSPQQSKHITEPAASLEKTGSLGEGVAEAEKTLDKDEADGTEKTLNGFVVGEQDALQNDANGDIRAKEEKIFQLKHEIDQKVAEMAAKAAELIGLESPFRSKSVASEAKQADAAEELEEKTEKSSDTKEITKTIIETQEGESKQEEVSTSREIDSLKDDESQATQIQIKDESLGKIEAERPLLKQGTFISEKSNEIIEEKNESLIEEDSKKDVSEKDAEAESVTAVVEDKQKIVKQTSKEKAKTKRQSSKDSDSSKKSSKETDASKKSPKEGDSTAASPTPKEEVTQKASPKEVDSTKSSPKEVETPKQSPKGPEGEEEEEGEIVEVSEKSEISTEESGVQQDIVDSVPSSVTETDTNQDKAIAQKEPEVPLVQPDKNEKKVEMKAKKRAKDEEKKVKICTPKANDGKPARKEESHQEKKQKRDAKEPIRRRERDIEREVKPSKQDAKHEKKIEPIKPHLIKADSFILGRRKKKRTKSPESSLESKSSEEEEETYTSPTPSTESSISAKVHKSFTILEGKVKKESKVRMKEEGGIGSRKSRSPPKKGRSRSEETGRGEKSPQKFKRSKIPTPTTNLRRNLSKSDKHLDRKYNRKTQSSIETRIPSLPNLGDNREVRYKPRPRSESNIAAPFGGNLYTDDDFDTGSDLEDVTSSAARKKRWKKRPRSRGKSAGSDYDSSNVIDSGFEPSPRSVRPSKWKNMSDRGVNMVSVQQTIQNNIRRYHLERKIFQHLLDLKRLQIRSGQHNETVLVKRAIDAYHQSCAATVGAGRYTSEDYSFRSFEHFLYHALRKLQKNGGDHLKGLPETPSNPLFCTQSTHRCLHATHAYTGVPCAAYLPKLDHHTIPKIGFECKPQGFLPHIGSKKAVTLELSHGNDKQVISLPADRLDQNKRYYVTFTVKGHENITTNSEEPKDTSHRHARSD